MGRLSVLWSRMTTVSCIAALVTLLASAALLRVAVEALAVPYLGIPMALVFVATAWVMQYLFWSEK